MAEFEQTDLHHVTVTELFNEITVLLNFHLTIS